MKKNKKSEIDIKSGIKFLIGVLNLPPKLWSDGSLDIKQRHACYQKAADILGMFTDAQLEELQDMYFKRESLGKYRDSGKYQKPVIAGVGVKPDIEPDIKKD